MYDRQDGCLCRLTSLKCVCHDLAYSSAESFVLGGSFSASLSHCYRMQTVRFLVQPSRCSKGSEVR